MTQDRSGKTAYPVDLALVLAIDTSGSVSDERLALQIRGYSDAFRRDDLMGAIRAGRYGRIAATFVEWSDAGRQAQSVDWTMIDGPATAGRFADAILAALSPTPGWTSISGAIDFSAGLLANLHHAADRKVIDISGDGVNNDGRPVRQARDAAVGAGITINGLPILEVEPRLDAYYRNEVIGGPHAFLVVARDRASFATAVMDKLLAEIAGGEPVGAPFSSEVRGRRAKPDISQTTGAFVADLGRHVHADVSPPEDTLRAFLMRGEADAIDASDRAVRLCHAPAAAAAAPAEWAAHRRPSAAAPGFATSLADQVLDPTAELAAGD